jgi:Flp pilus assembly pilin Flp
MLTHLVALSSCRKQRGLTTVEYAIAGALIAVAIVVAFGIFGDGIKAGMTYLTGLMDGK